jgi:hypothetical protein
MYSDVIACCPDACPAKPRLVRADDLVRFTGAGPQELVRVRGAVTMVVAGSDFILHTEGGGL